MTAHLEITISLIILVILCSCTSPRGTADKIISSRELRGCVSGNCKNGYGKYVYPDGSEYIGYWKNFRRDGYGSFIFPHQSVQDSSYQYNINVTTERKITAEDNASSVNPQRKYDYEEMKIKRKNPIEKAQDAFTYVDEQNKARKKIKATRSSSNCEVKYEGFWKNDQLHGRVRKTERDCTVTDGFWENDIRIK